MNMVNKVTKFALIVEFLRKNGFKKVNEAPNVDDTNKTFMIGADPSNRTYKADTAFWIRIWNGIHGDEVSVEGKEENTHIWVQIQTNWKYIREVDATIKRIDLTHPDSLKLLSKLIGIKHNEV